MLYDKYRPTMLRSLLRLYTKELKALDSANRMKQRRLSIYMTYTNNGDNRVSTAYSTLSLRFFFFFIFILLFVSGVFRLVYCFMISKGELII